MNKIVMNKTSRTGGWKRAGFTLLELMIVVAIIAILAAIAVPSYIKYVTKTNRAAAEGCLSEYANYMERFYTTNLSYSTNQSTGAVFTAASLSSIGLDCSTASQTGNSYTYSFPAAPTSTTYTVQAVPINAQLTRDTQCGTLALDQAGNRTISSTTGTVLQCWGG